MDFVLNPWLFLQGYIPTEVYTKRANIDKQQISIAKPTLLASPPLCCHFLNISEEEVDGESHCPICIEEFEVGGAVRNMPCGHGFHAKCILSWLLKCKSCPVCRHLVTKELSG